MIADPLQQLQTLDAYDLVETKEGLKVYAYDRMWPLASPFAIELTAYRYNWQGNALKHMVNAHHLAWPNDVDTWNYWTERRFNAHVEGHKIIPWAGGANALPLHEVVATPSGWARIGLLKEGDVICNPRGGVQTVVKLHPVEEKEYFRITFSDGTSILSCEEHFWPIQTKYMRSTGQGFKKVMTKDLPLSGRPRIPTTVPLEYIRQDIPLDPYLLGAFLGDGSYRSNTPKISMTAKKAAVLDYLLSCGGTSGSPRTRQGYAVEYTILLGAHKAALQTLNLKGVRGEDKFIPDCYRYNTTACRVKVLAGLLDTDGAQISPSALKFTTTSSVLSSHTAELARSLGYKVKETTRQRPLPRKTLYQLTLLATDTSASLPLLRLNSIHPAANGSMIIQSVEPAGKFTGRCITVSGEEGWFITKNCLVTGNCGKSYDAAKLALLFWLANPMGRTVLVASTSLSDLDSRIWGYVKRFHRNAGIDLAGTLYTSPPPKILWHKEDTVHGMFAVPFQRGSANKTASTLIGRHPDEGFLAIVDEGTDVTPGFMDAVPNWEKSPYFQMIVIGNSSSMYDPHGLLSRPVNGWDSIDPDYDREWPTKDGVCLYFDCYNSPAIHEKDPVKKEKLGKFLFTEEGIEKAKETYGENSPAFWRFTRGFWPLDDIVQTVLTAVMVDRFKIKGQAHWSGEFKLHRLAGLDPAFTPEGDECILRFATLGHTLGGRWVLDYGGPENIHRLTIDAESDVPAEYQIVQQTMQLCMQQGVGPQDLAVDVWGPGSGLGSIFDTVWSPDVYKVSSAGTPTDTWVDSEMTQLAKEAYDRRVTELWFSMRKFVQAGQIKGLDDLSCEQFCTRQYVWKGKKYSIETKEDYKLRLGKVDRKYVSPDRADAACLILDLARQYYNFIPGAVLEGGAADPTPLQRYLHQRGLSDPAADETGVRSGHPHSWGDGFTVSDLEEM